MRRESEIRSAAVVIVSPTKKAPRGGRLSTGCGGHLITPRTAGRVSVDSRMPCLGPGREGKEITFGRRDARGLTFSAVIPARVLQPGISTRGEQSWRIALCGYGMTLAPRHRVHLVCVASLAVIPGRTLLEGRVRVGSRASPQLQGKPLFSWRWPAGVPVPVPAKTRSAAPAVYALGAWICGQRCPQSRFPVSGRTCARAVC
ncbi:MAG: hypothetical protein RLZZ516_2656 [Cyanobacteriota bacterium]